MPCWGGGKRDADRYKRDQGEEATPNISGVNSAPHNEIINWASEKECQTGNPQSGWMAADQRQATHSRGQKTRDNGEKHHPLVGFAIVTPQEACPDKEGECENISKRNQKNCIYITQSISLSKPCRAKCNEQPENYHRASQDSASIAEQPVKTAAI